MTEKVMQLTLKSGIHIAIGVQSKEDFTEKKKHILKSADELVTIIEECVVRRESIDIIEYFEREIKGDDAK